MEKEKKSMNKIRILFVNGGTVDYGGIATFLINYIKYFDFNEFEVHIAVHGSDNGPRAHELISRGCIFHQLPIKSKSYFQWKQKYNYLLKKYKFDIVHANADAGNGPLLKIAKKHRVPVRISHSHNTQLLTTNKIRVFLNNIQKRQILKYATNLFACSKLAGKWLYGNNKFEIINNAIDYDNFRFDEDKRIKIRKELQFDNEVFVVGHVGRFDYQKNHKFIVELAQQFDNNVQFILIGDGHLRKKIEEVIKQKNVNNIKILGSKDNISHYYNAMDCFILPSLFEGLSVVSIEAQVNGLVCLFSNTITHECKISDNTDFFTIDSVENWVQKIRDIVDMKKCDREIVLDEKYNVKIQSKQLQDKLKKYLNTHIAYR